MPRKRSVSSPDDRGIAAKKTKGDDREIAAKKTKGGKRSLRKQDELVPASSSSILPEVTTEQVVLPEMGPRQLVQSSTMTSAAETDPSGIVSEILPSVTENPSPVQSIHNMVGSHVSTANKQKIIPGQYIDLAVLLDTTEVTQQNDHKLVICNGEVVTRVKPVRWS